MLFPPETPKLEELRELLNKQRRQLSNEVQRMRTVTYYNHLVVNSHSRTSESITYSATLKENIVSSSYFHGNNRAATGAHENFRERRAPHAPID